MNAIATRILSGEQVCPAEVLLDCAARLRAWIEDTPAHHTADTCRARKRKDCAHFPGAGEVALMQHHQARAAATCVCGNHQGAT